MPSSIDGFGIHFLACIEVDMRYRIVVVHRKGRHITVEEMQSAEGR